MQTQTHRHRHTDTDTHTDTHTHTHTHTHRDTHTHTDTHRHRQRHRHTHTHKPPAQTVTAYTRQDTLLQTHSVAYILGVRHLNVLASLNIQTGRTQWHPLDPNVPTPEMQDKYGGSLKCLEKALNLGVASGGLTQGMAEWLVHFLGSAMIFFGM